VFELLGNRGFRLRSVDGQEWKAGEGLAENNLWASRT
jgi:hypothetical protein